MNAELLVGAVFSGLAAVLIAFTGLLRVMRSSREELTVNERRELIYLRELVLALETNVFRLKASLRKNDLKLPELEPEPVKPDRMKALDDDAGRSKHREDHR